MNNILLDTTRAFNNGCRYIINEGGTRSGKTFAVLTALVALAVKRRNAVLSVVSETYPHLRKGAIRDFQTILTGMGAWDENCWSKTESTYTFPSGSIIEFFSCDNAGKVHGPARDHLFINEAQNIHYDIARHLFVRTRGTIFIDFNPTHEFWSHTDLKELPETKWIHSTYLDNPHLTPAQVGEIERQRKNANWWKVYGEGQIGMLEGLVFPGWEMTDTIPDNLPARIGLDWGFTNDPTAIVHCHFKGDTVYLDEITYQTSMVNGEITKVLKAHPCKIIADSSEPKSIEEIYRAGVNIHPCVKGQDSVRAGINLMLSKTLVVTKRSTNLINELRNYTWDSDKTGKLLNAPVDQFNHAIDAARYAITDYYNTPTFYTFTS